MAFGVVSEDKLALCMHESDPCLLAIVHPPTVKKGSTLSTVTLPKYLGWLPTSTLLLTLKQDRYVHSTFISIVYFNIFMHILRQGMNVLF